MTLRVSGPTYGEMLHPRTLPAAFREMAAIARKRELDPANLFNISWKDQVNNVRYVLLPHQLTGTEANILVLVGRAFPSGSHKVGPAYATLMEAELEGKISADRTTIIGPSTGNFGIGVAYIAKVKGYRSVVIMPEQMSSERYERIRKYGGELDLTPGSESDVILVLERTLEYKKNPENFVLGQFELMPNYRFHRYVTGQSALEAARECGNGRIAAYVAAPGSAGTLAAGDEIKSAFPDAVVCAPEPKECSTLFNNGRGTHRIEGIGDKMVTLIHNVLSTDWVILIHDEDCVAGLELLERHQPELEEILGLPAGTMRYFSGIFGVSGICNLLAAIRMARQLGLGAGENVVTVATDGLDRYDSVLAAMYDRVGKIKKQAVRDSFERIFRGGNNDEILDVRPRDQKQRLFSYKDATWSRFGYSPEYLYAMKEQAFWDNEYRKISVVDAALKRQRSHISGQSAAAHT